MIAKSFRYCGKFRGHTEDILHLIECLDVHDNEKYLKELFDCGRLKTDPPGWTLIGAGVLLGPDLPFQKVFFRDREDALLYRKLNCGKAMYQILLAKVEEVLN